MTAEAHIQHQQKLAKELFTEYPTPMPSDMMRLRLAGDELYLQLRRFAPVEDLAAHKALQTWINLNV